MRGKTAPGPERVDSVASARAFVKEHGVVLFAGKGPAPNLVDAIAGEKVHGSWWGHSAGKRIFQLANELEDSPDILWCRLLGGKRTLVHRRVWPALARLSGEIDPERLAWVRQEHTESGAHRTIEEPFAKWIDAASRKVGQKLTREEAIAMLPPGYAGGGGARRHFAIPRGPSASIAKDRKTSGHPRARPNASQRSSRS